MAEKLSATFAPTAVPPPEQRHKTARYFYITRRKLRGRKRGHSKHTSGRSAPGTVTLASQGQCRSEARDSIAQIQSREAVVVRQVMMNESVESLAG